ncbi:hypothetical protein J437_LFUL003395 [Ladona fulva]|uniref:Uncharacterized protein n=1 Tax=Ladona fulva TaxID=123851 RepID=A0A8K0K419_LADFU|nr:hypothetical protein J437_LFUL003395 [Ladona fulva]
MMGLICKLKSGEVKSNELKTQIRELRQKLEETQEALACKEIHLARIMQQKKILSVEFSKLSGIIRSLRQQLEDERWLHHNQYSWENEEMSALKSCCFPNDETGYSLRKQSFLYDCLKKMEASAATSSEIVYNMCLKFFRMKYLRDVLQKRLSEEIKERKFAVQSSKDLFAKFKEIEKMVHNCHQNQPPLSQSQAIIMQMISKNGRLEYEKALLQLEIRKLRNSERIKLMRSRCIQIKVEAPGESAIEEDGTTDSSTCSSPIEPHEIMAYVDEHMLQSTNSLTYQI